MLFATPIAAVILTIIFGAILFEILGYDGIGTVREIFFTPVLAAYKWQDVMTKAAPLIIIALGLSLGNQAKVWNIGAEGQYIVGALAGAFVAYLTPGVTTSLVIIPMIIAGILGGAAWAAIPAFLKTKLNVNEVLTSLMLVYVAFQLLGYLVTGPWKDPNGHNFPQTAPFTDAQLLPHSLFGTPIPPGLVIALLLMLGFWLLVSRSVYGFEVRVVGAAPSAARYAGFNASRTIWACRYFGSHQPIGSAQSGLSFKLRLHGHHRLIPWSAASRWRVHCGHCSCHHLCGRAGGTDHGSCALSLGRYFPSHDAVSHSRR
jgi:simple sugar transport system permease protein